VEAPPPAEVPAEPAKELELEEEPDHSPAAALSMSSAAVAPAVELPPAPAPQPEAPPRVPKERPAKPPRRAGAPSAGRFVLIAGIAAVVAAVIGYLVSPSSGGSSAPPQPALVGSASAGPLAISFPAGWQHQSGLVTHNLTLANQIGVSSAAPASGQLILGTANSNDPTLLPSSILSALSTAPTPQVVTLGHSQFYRYLDLTPSGASAPETIYALPTTAGIVIAVCQPNGAGAAFMSACEQVVSTLQLSSGKVLGLGPSTTYASGFSALISKLSAARTGAEAKLASATTPAAQAKAATDLSTAYQQAASALGALSPPPAAASANASAAAALHAIASGYAALALAAKHNDHHRYASAQDAIAHGSDALSAAFSQLAKLGYVTS
jgi:hypothetical protein